MPRTRLAAALLGIMLLGSLGVVQAPRTSGQEATPAAEESLPLEILGTGPSTATPEHALVLVEVTFPVDFTETQPHVHPYDYVVSVQSGTYTFEIEAGTLLLTRAGATEPAPVPTGIEITVGPGDSFAGTPDVVWGPERVEGGEPVILLAAILEVPGTTDPVYVDATPVA
jgi:hypothetical protein